jgi:hypothetical protein
VRWYLAWVDGPDTPQCHRTCNAREDDTLAEIDQHSVAHVLGDKAVEIVDRLTDRAIVVADLLAQILGVEPRRQRSRADKIAEHDRQLPPFGVGLNRRRYGSQHRR